eukprot:tig00000248_g21811.t1
MLAEIRSQEALISFLTAVAAEVKAGKAKPSEFLAAALSGTPLPTRRDAPPPPSSPFHAPGPRPTFPLPVNPDVIVDGFLPEEAAVFTSKQQPLRVACTTASGPSFLFIFKSGDDLRQDQLVVQLIALMDAVLRRQSLDLRLTPYRVLATSQNSGMVEFVGSSAPLSRVLQDHGKDIHAFLRRHNPAGYCVVSYVLGIGDRHLDNLMLATDGRLFHIDFGYIFGREPKMKVPYLPPMKISSEMVQGLGGKGSPHYSRFLTLCSEAYSILRKSSGLFASLIRLMAHSGIPDVGPDPEAAVIKLLERLRPELSEEEASLFMLAVVGQSVSSLAGHAAEIIHRVAQWGGGA